MVINHIPIDHLVYIIFSASGNVDKQGLPYFSDECRDAEAVSTPSILSCQGIKANG